MTQRPGELQESLCAALGGDEHAVGAHELQDGDDLPAAREVVRGDRDHRVVQAYPLPVGQVGDVKLGRDRHAHALAARHDLDLARRREGSHEGRERLRRA